VSEAAIAFLSPADWFRKRCVPGATGLGGTGSATI
jgi:hypothetical protein